MNIDQKTLDDYLAFFTTKEGADILPYFYLENSHLFDELVRNSKSYYIFKDEVELIKNNKSKLEYYLSDISDLVEIGPGSYYSIEHKTLPILSYAPKLRNYYALDFCKDYLSNIYEYLIKNTKGLNISTIEVDFMLLNEKNISQINQTKKAFIMLGGTFGGLNNEQQNHFLQNIYNLMKEDDLFILTTDTNQDKISLIEAYSEKHSYKLVFASLEYFATIYPTFKPYLNSFKLKFEWRPTLSLVDISFVAMKKLTFCYPR